MVARIRRIRYASISGLAHIPGGPAYLGGCEGCRQKRGRARGGARKIASSHRFCIPRRHVVLPWRDAAAGAPERVACLRPRCNSSAIQPVDLGKAVGYVEPADGERGTSAETRGDASLRRADRGGEARLSDLRTDRAGAG